MYVRSIYYDSDIPGFAQSRSVILHVSTFFRNPGRIVIFCLLMDIMCSRGGDHLASMLCGRIALFNGICSSLRMEVSVPTENQDSRVREPSDRVEMLTLDYRLDNKITTCIVTEEEASCVSEIPGRGAEAYNTQNHGIGFS